MSLSDQILAALVQYGLPVLFGVIVFASSGVPLPATLLLIAAGAFVEQGDLDLWWVVGFGLAAAVIGDHLGYGIGRWGGARIELRINRWLGGPSRLEAANRATQRWGGLAIFFSRWLFTPLGPPLNYTSGIARYPLGWFFCCDVAGEIIWVIGYVLIGRVFNDRVEAMNALLGDLSWISVACVAVVVLGWLLIRSFRSGHPEAPDETDRGRATEPQSWSYDEPGFAQDHPSLSENTRG
ncbi:MAG TPA: DedA family protein [Herpetosiphonaceae bacterium]